MFHIYPRSNANPNVRPGGWGRVKQAWPAVRFEAALNATPGSSERFQLVGALTGAFYKNVSHLAASQVEMYTSLDEVITCPVRNSCPK